MRNPTSIVLLIISSFITLCGIAYLCFFQHHLWETITGIATVWVVFVAYKQLGDYNMTTRADFISRFSDKFFKKETRDLIMLLDPDNDALTYQGGENPYFKINESVVDKLCMIEEKRRELKDRKIYSVYEIDDWFLGHLEDIGFFEKSGLINIEEVYNHFDWYISDVAGKNKAIEEYIKASNEEEAEGGIGDIYENYEYILKKLHSYRREKERHSNS